LSFSRSAATRLHRAQRKRLSPLRPLLPLSPLLRFHFHPHGHFHGSPGLSFRRTSLHTGHLLTHLLTDLLTDIPTHCMVPLPFLFPPKPIPGHPEERSDEGPALARHPEEPCDERSAPILHSFQQSLQPHNQCHSSSAFCFSIFLFSALLCVLCGVRSSNRAMSALLPPLARDAVPAPRRSWGFRRP